MLDLCYQYFGSDMYVAYIHIPGNTHEECDYYVLCTVEKYIGDCRRFIYLYRTEPVKARGVHVSDPDFFRLVLLWDVPYTIVGRWCLRVFKLEVLRNFMYGRRYVTISGVTASSRFRIEYASKSRDGLLLPHDIGSYARFDILLMPIHDWPREAVLRYIKERDLKLNPLYSKIGHSGNCMLCPSYLSSIDRILHYLNRLEKYEPHWYRKILHLFHDYMRTHRQLVKCDRPCSKCPYMKDRNRYVYAKRIGIVLELLSNDIRRFLHY